jgi:hypothetical protein
VKSVVAYLYPCTTTITNTTTVRGVALIPTAICIASPSPGMGQRKWWWWKVWGRRTTDFTDWTDQRDRRIQQFFRPRSQGDNTLFAILLILLRSRGGENQPPRAASMDCCDTWRFRVPLSAYFNK